MSPEAVDYMATAEASLDRARRALLAEIYEDAARDAYASALNAARAIIFDKTGLAVKSHSGTRAMLHELVWKGLAFDRNLVDFLAKAFEVRQRVEYGPPTFVQRAEAEEYIKHATAFLAAAKTVCK
jgi:uncharacterized protein (UPF0332 family)